MEATKTQDCELKTLQAALEQLRAENSRLRAELGRGLDGQVQGAARTERWKESLPHDTWYEHAAVSTGLVSEPIASQWLGNRTDPVWFATHQLATDEMVPDEALLDETRARLRVVVDQCADFILEVDPRGWPRFQNRPLLGVAWDAPFFHWAIPEDREGLREALDEVLRGGSPRAYVVAVNLPDERRALFALRITGIRVENVVTGALILARELDGLSNPEEARLAIGQPARAYCDSAPFRMGIVEVRGLELTFLWVNAAFARSWGIAYDAGAVRAADLGFSSSEIALWRSRCQQSANSSAPVRFELYDANTDRWLQNTVAPLLGATPHDCHFCFFAEDITLRKRMEQALRESDQKYRALLNALPDAMYVIRRDGVFMEFHAPDVRFLLAPSSRILGRNLRDVLAPELCPLVAGAVNRALDTGQMQVIEFSHSQGQNQNFFEARFVPCGEDTSLMSLRLTTDRKRAERALRESEERFRRLLESVPGVLVMGYGPEGTIHYWNGACTTVLGYSASEAIGRNLLDLVIPPSGRGEARAAIEWRSRTGQVSPPDEWLLQHHNGQAVLVYVSHVVVAMDERQPEVFSFAVDLTERRRGEAERVRMERKLQEIQKLESLGVLAGGIAHDFNNLLTGILCNANLAQMDLACDSPVQLYLTQIESTSLRAADLCKQMLAYSGKAQFVVQPLDLSELVRETIPLIKMSISKMVTVNYRLSDGLPAVPADATQIRQVIMNLVINASEAMEDRQGAIEVSTDIQCTDRDYLSTTVLAPELPGGQYVYLEVRDNGLGMDEETLAKIFDPFFTTKFTGRGLGLAVVLGIVRGHRGALKVESQPGQGTIFRVLLPIAREPAQPTPTTPPSGANPIWRGSGTVLVVDDEDSVLNVTMRMLQAMGMETLAACDGRQALEVFQHHVERIHLVLLDLTMPVMSGEETLRELRRLHPRVRVVVMSGYSQEDIARRYPSVAVEGFLQKPFRAQELVEVLRAALQPT